MNEGNTGTTATCLTGLHFVNINIMEYLYFLELVGLLTSCETQKESIYTVVWLTYLTCYWFNLLDINNITNNQIFLSAVRPKSSWPVKRQKSDRHLGSYITNNPIIGHFWGFFFFFLPLCQNESLCEALIHMTMCSMHLQVHFHANSFSFGRGFERGLVLKQRHRVSYEMSYY